MSSSASKSSSGVITAAVKTPARGKDAAPINMERFLMELADTLNTTLDFDTLLSQVALLVQRMIPYEIFAILIVNEKTHDLRMRFQIGHQPEVEKIGRAHV